MTAPPSRSADADTATTSASRPAGVSRRAMLRGGGLIGGGLVAGAAGASAGWALADSPPAAPAPGPASAGIPPDDDLMREHGVLKRVLLCYREMTSRIQAGQPVAAAELHGAALIIHDYDLGQFTPPRPDGRNALPRRAPGTGPRSSAPAGRNRR